MARAKRLGKGLDALFGGDQSLPLEAGTVQEIPLDEIRPNPFQPRRDFDEAKIAELASSIEQHGLVQPVLVCDFEDGYQLVAGERRWRAAQMAGLVNIPAIVRSMTQEQMMEIALVENVQREDLNPIEEAAAYQALVDELDLTQSQVAERVGKSRSQVANMLRLLQLDQSVRDLVSQGAISTGHAKVILALEDERQADVARQVVAGGLSVRETEELVKQVQAPGAGGSSGGQGGLEKSGEQEADAASGSTGADEAILRDLEQKLRDHLSTPVAVQHGDNKGKIVIHYFDQEDLMRVTDRLLGLET